MRISTQQFFDAGMASTQKHASDVMRAQQQISSGNKFTRASDNALAAGLGVQVTLDNGQFAMFKVNQDYVTASLASTDTQLGNIQLAVQRFQQLMVQAGSDSIGPEGRKILGEQAKSLIGLIEQLAAAKDANGQKILRDSTPAKVLVAPSVEIETGLAASAVMGSTSNTNDVDMLDFLKTIRDKLLLVTPQGPSTQDFEKMKALANQVTSAQVRVGLLQNQLDAAIEVNAAQSTNVEMERSTLLDTDLAEATASLAKSNALLQAAQTIMSRLDINNLFTKL